MDLPPEAGRIVRLIPTDGFMEAYTTGGTFQVRTPDNVDPARTNPEMPWTQAKASGAGTTNPIVARLFIQAHDVLQQLILRRGDKKKLLVNMRLAKEEMLNCETAFMVLQRETETVEQLIRSGQVRRSGSSIQCPQVNDLDRCATQFIASAKRALQAAGEVYNEFYQPGRGGLMKNGNLGFAVAHLAAQTPPNGDYLHFLKENEPAVKRLIELRNGQEHADAASRTVIEDVQLASGGFVPPTWRLLPGPPSPILSEMAAALPFLVSFIESNFFFGLLENTESIGFVQRLQMIPPSERDPDCPMAYRLVYERDTPDLDQAKGVGLES